LCFQWANELIAILMQEFWSFRQLPYKFLNTLQYFSQGPNNLLSKLSRKEIRILERLKVTQLCQEFSSASEDREDSEDNKNLWTTNEQEMERSRQSHSNSDAELSDCEKINELHLSEHNCGLQSFVLLVKRKIGG